MSNSEKVKHACRAYFDQQILHNVTWAPNKICRTGYIYFLDWWMGKRKALPFGVPMIWTDSGDHDTTYENKQNRKISDIKFTRAVS